MVERLINDAAVERSRKNADRVVIDRGQSPRVQDGPSHAVDAGGKGRGKKGKGKR